jgi:hypothetical protein
MAQKAESPGTLPARSAVLCQCGLAEARQLVGGLQAAPPGLILGCCPPLHAHLKSGSGPACPAPNNRFACNAYAWGDQDLCKHGTT